MSITTGARWILVSLPLLLIPAFVWCTWPQPRVAVYSLYRANGRGRTLEALNGYAIQRSEHFELYYTEADANVADLILETAESVYAPVIERVGHQPPGPVPLIVYPSRDELRSAFGWGNGESAMGVYWSGTIRLLSPNVWISEAKERERRRVFRKINPIAHELTHYVLDYLTNGNYPRWFTEGLAQRVEYQVTGYLWLEPESTLRQELYTMVDLRDRFDKLSNQPLAYRQSYLVVEYMVDRYGQDSLSNLIQMLGDGVNFTKAVEQAYGKSPEQIYAEWEDWLPDHLDQLEPVS